MLIPLPKINSEVWPGGFRDGQLLDVINQINAISITIPDPLAPVTEGVIGAGFDNRPYVIGYVPPVQVTVPYSGTITSVIVTADTPGSAVVDVAKCTYATYPTFLSIVAAAPPTLSAAQKSLDTTLTGWNKAVLAGDSFLFTLLSSSSVGEVVVEIAVTKTS